MNDFATKNYNTIYTESKSQSSILRKIKYALFAALCISTLCGVLATTAEVGVHMQMARISNHSN